MERLKESSILKDLSSVIINNAFDAIIYYIPIKNKKNIIVDFEFAFMNDSAFKYLTGTREKYIGKSFLSLFPYATVNGMFDAFRKTAETGKSSENIYYYEYGEYKGWYRDSVIKHGEGIIVYFRDVTSQKSLELELENKSVELKKLLKEKELLLRETHHRIKNNLQILASMISLQCDNIEDQHCRDLLYVSRQRIINMARIHQGFYESQSYSSIKFNKFVRELVASLASMYNEDYKKVDINYEIEELDFGLDDTVNIGLIINELITNSVKHAFKEKAGGLINISIKQQNNILELIISDNGKGMNKDFKIENSNSLGLMIVKALVDQMSGTIKLINTSGTTFIINIPLSLLSEKPN